MSGLGSLRAELGGTVDLPPFSMLLPQGWVGYVPDDATRDRMLERARARLMRATRPDLYAQLQGLVRCTWSDMQRVGTRIVVGPGTDAPESACLPASMSITLRTAPAGSRFVDVIRSVVQRYGAHLLERDPRFVTFRRRDSVQEAGARVATTSVVYLAPLPGDARRAIQATVVLTHPADVDDTAEPIAELVALFDACIASFSWEAP